MCVYVDEMITYLGNNQGIIPNYWERYRYGEPISTAFVELTVNEVIAKRMAKKTANAVEPRRCTLPFTNFLNDELESLFCRWYPKLNNIALDVMAA